MNRQKFEVIGNPYNGKPVGTVLSLNHIEAKCLVALKRVRAVDGIPPIPPEVRRGPGRPPKTRDAAADGRGAALPLSNTNFPAE